VIILYGLIGCAVGSFLNVVIDRVPAKRSLLSPPSHCPTCGRRLRALELIPVLTYLLLRGRCHTCDARIPRRILWVELGTGLLYGFLWWHHGPTWQLVVSSVYVCVLLVIAVIDLEHKLIPNVIVLPATGLTLLAIPMQRWIVPSQYYHYGLARLLVGVEEGARLSNAQMSMLSQLLGGLVAFAVFLLIWLIAPCGIGAGDLKLAGFAGLVTAFPGAILAVLGSFVLGGAVGLILLLGGMAKRKAAVPFAPFLAVTTFLVMVYGDSLLQRYLGS
jgi:leader peptidase (prepilin peptidase)/N-methyltransferase